MEFLNKIGEKICEAFSIFDLTYFISGLATCLILLIYIQDHQELEKYLILKQQVHWILWVVVIYIAGLISFSLGRILRQYILLQKFAFYTLFDSFYTDESFEKARKYYFLRRLFHLQHKKYARKKMDQSYAVLWTTIRNEEKYKPTYDYICKYWITSAIYEGLLFSCVLTMILFYHKPAFFWGAIVCAIACILEARRNTQIMIKDVIVCAAESAEDR